MRRVTVLIMVFMLPLSIFAGIAESLPFHAGRPPEFHIFVAAVFTLTCVIHIWLNRKAIVRYFKGIK